jgi:hypothetical protein
VCKPILGQDNVNLTDFDRHLLWQTVVEGVERKYKGLNLFHTDENITDYFEPISETNTALIFTANHHLDTKVRNEIIALAGVVYN